MLEPEKTVYENKNYKLVIGLPPASRDNPNPVPAYLTINKETGVLETWQGILFYAKQNTDQLNDMLMGKFDNPIGKIQEVAEVEEEGPLPGERTRKKRKFN